MTITQRAQLTTPNGSQLSAPSDQRAGEDAEHRRTGEGPGGDRVVVVASSSSGLEGMRGDVGEAHPSAPENPALAMRRAIALTPNVITNSTRPVAISRLTSSPDDSGNCSAMLAAIVLEFCPVRTSQK